MDFPNIKLGKLPPRHDPRTLKLAKYVAGLPAPPEAVDYSRGIRQWGMLANDRLGCCTISAVGHAIQSWRLSLPNNGQVIGVPDAAIERYYQLWDGWSPLDPASDRGGVELDVLTKWRKSTFTVGIVGHNLKAFAAVDHLDLLRVKQAIQLFGGVYVGLQLPLSAQSQNVWDLAGGPEGAPGSWGGHAVWCVSYRRGAIGFITWGEYKEMTFQFWQGCCDECYALMSDTDWMQPDVVLYGELLADLAKVAN